MPRKRRHDSPLLPRYWGHWLAVGLLWSASHLPLAAQHWLGNRLGDLFHLLGRRRRHIARVNIDLCFPELGECERARLVREHFRAAGFALFETALSWWGSDRRLGKMATIEGLGHLQTALAQGKGALLLSAHFTTLELVGRLLILSHHPIAAMYRPHENPVIEYLFARNRGLHCERSIRRDDVKGLLRALKDNLPVWYAQDQSKGGRYSVTVPFFGEPAATQTATHRIARASGAPVLPFFGIREADGTYRLSIHPPLKDFPTDDPVRDTARINSIIEDAVRMAPEQYFWAHRRFKKRQGMADPYSRT